MCAAKSFSLAPGRGRVSALPHPGPVVFPVAMLTDQESFSSRSVKVLQVKLKKVLYLLSWNPFSDNFLQVNF